MGTLLRAKRDWVEWKLRNTSSSFSYSAPSNSPQIIHHRPQPLHIIGWKLPQGGFIKLNFDGTKSAAGAAAGFVLRNWQGGFITAGTRLLESAPILVAEATALRDGISTALQAGFCRIAVEGDNQVVLKAVQKQILALWQIAPIIENIWNMIPNCELISFSHIYREGNMAADWMAKYGCLLKSYSLSTFSYFPSREFISILVDDNLGTILVRRAA